MIYAVNMISILIYALILRPDKAKLINKKLFAIIVTVQLTCISGLQYDVGADYISYLRIYEVVRRMSWGELTKFAYFTEPIYCIYTKIMAVIFQDNFIPYFLGMAFVTSSFLMKAIYDRKENMVWSVYMYLSMGLFYISMNQMRQMMALSIILYTIKFIEEKDWKKYFFWILIAAGIHNSALIMLPCYFLRDIKLRSPKKTIGLLALVISIAYFFGPAIIENVLRNTTYGWMLNFEAGEVDNMIINLLFRVALLVGCIFYMRSVLRKNKKYEVLYWISIIGILFQIISVYATSVARITTFFYAIFIFLVPLAITNISNRSVRIIAKLTIIVGMLCYHIFYLVYRLGFLEYQSIFSVI